MIDQARLRRQGWAYVVAGIAAIFFGVAALAWPGLGLAVFVPLFGVYVFVDGIAHLFATFQAYRTRTTWWPQLLLAIVDIAAGLFVIAYPGLTTILFVYVVAFWAMALGLVAIVGGLLGGNLGAVITGVVAIVLGLVLLQNPVRGALAYIVVIGAFAIVRGVLLLADAAHAPEAAR